MGSGSNVPSVPQPPKMFAPPASEIDTGVLDIALSRKQPKRSGYITRGQTIGESGQLIQAPKREMASAAAATGQAAFSQKEELKGLADFNPAGFSQLISMYQRGSRNRATDFFKLGEGQDPDAGKEGRQAATQDFRERASYKSNLLKQYENYVAEYNKQQAQREKQKSQF
jgi:hypothetical protein